MVLSDVINSKILEVGTDFMHQNSIGSDKNFVIRPQNFLEKSLNHDILTPCQLPLYLGATRKCTFNYFPKTNIVILCL